MSDAEKVTIGVDRPGGLNVISGNGQHGIDILVFARTVKIVNNNIGVGKDRTKKGLNLGNEKHGISLENATLEVIIKKNEIKDNGIENVRDPNKRTKIADPNLISGSPGIGIDIGSEGVTPGESPTITSAEKDGNTVSIQGTLDDLEPNTEYFLEFFGNQVTSAADAEGEFFLGDHSVTTDSNGDASFDVTFDAVFGNYVTATFTDFSEDGYTSEFSQAVELDGGATGDAVLTGLVWEDADGDGIQEDGEDGIDDVTIKLWTSTDTLYDTTDTLSDGSYSFEDVDPGDYYLEFIAPSGHAFTLAYQADFHLDSDADPADGKTAVFTLTAGEVNPYFDAGLFATAAPTVTAVGPSFGSSDGGTVVTITGTTLLYATAVKFGSTDATSFTIVSGTTIEAVAPALSVGTYHVTVTTPWGTSSTSSSDEFDSVAPTATVLTASLDPVPLGDSVTFTATVTGGGSTPTGTVTFFDGSTQLGSDTLDGSGVATFDTDDLTVGYHHLTARYNGDPASYAASVDAYFINVVDEVTWDGGGTDGNWNTPANWDTDAVPDEGQSVVIPTGATVTLDSGDAVVRDLDVAGALIVSGGTLTVADDSTVEDLTLSGGALTVHGDFTVADTFTWTGGTMDGYGEFILDEEAVASLDGTTLVVDGLTVDSAGAVTVAADTTLDLQNWAAFFNLGSFALDDAALTSSTEDGLFINYGTFSGDGGDATVGVAFTNGGDVAATSGTLTFQSVDVTLLDGSSVEGAAFDGATLSLADVDSATLTDTSFVDATLSAGGALALSGTTLLDVESSFDVEGSLTLDGTLDLQGGTVAVVNGLVIESGSTLSGYGSIVGDVTNNGTIDVGGADAFGTLLIDGDFTNGSTGVLNMEAVYIPDGYDVLSVSGTATLGGTLNFSLLDSHTPDINYSYSLLEFGSRSGTFATLNLPTLGTGTWDPRYDDPLDTFTLWVV